MVVAVVSEVTQQTLVVVLAAAAQKQRMVVLARLVKVSRAGIVIVRVAVLAAVVLVLSV